MKEIIVYGLNSLSKELIKFIQFEKKNVIKYIVLDRKYITYNHYEDIKIIAYEDLKKIYENNQEILITFGYSNMNKLKKSKYEQCKNDGYKIHTYISEKAMVYTDNIGEGNIIMPNVVVSNGVILNKCNIIYPSVVIGHDCNIGSFNFIASSVTILGKAIIGDRCFLGGNSTILDAKKVADATLVGAGAILSQDTEDEQVILPEKSKILNKKSDCFFNADSSFKS